MKFTNRWPTLRGLTGIVSGIVLGAGLASTASAMPQSLNFAPISSDYNSASSQLLFVRFETPSVAERAIATRKLARTRPALRNTATADFSRAAQSRHARQIATEQSSYRKMLESLGAKIESTMRVGANGMRIRVHPSQVPAIRALPGVRSVSRVVTHTLDLSNSVGWVGAPAVWEGIGEGEGITIAIIDSGVDYLHASMGGSGDPAEYAANDFNVIEPGTFPNDKVIGGFDFAGPTYDAGDPSTFPEPDPDPLDGNGHGSHVAGIAAGLGVEGAIGPGVAKGASIMALKVFSDTSGSTNLTADAIEYALDPNGDGDISDHVDVINMSLGSPFGLPNDPSAIAASNAAELGIIVVASAGNSGNVPYVTGAPAVGPKVISVAASLTGGDVPAIAISAPEEGLHEAVEGVGEVRVADGAVSGNLVIAEPLQACSADDDGNPVGLDNDIAGGIALVQRGGCTFDLKYLNAQASNARAIIVYNDGAAPSRVAPITMGGVGNLGIPVTIPGVMIASTAGDFLNATISGGSALSAAVDADLRTPTLFADTMAAFSSGGPGHGGSLFKPDMTAPGVGTISTGAGSGNAGLSLSGTSMAAPHVAGAAALMRQAFPDAPVAAIKAMLMNSTSDAQPDGLIGPPHAMSRQGVGVLRVDQASTLSSYASPAGMAFGRINATKKTKVKAPLWVTNLSDEDRTFEITHVPQQGMDGVSFKVPGHVTVKAGKTKRIKMEMSLDPSEAPADDGSFSQTEVDGWFVLNDGVDTLRVGYLAAVDAASKLKAKDKNNARIELKNGGPAGGVAEGFTLSLIGSEAEDDGDDDEDGSDEIVIERGGDEGNDEPVLDTSAVNAFGFRTNEVAGFPVVELAIDLHEHWESMSNRTFDIYLDVDQDGSDDVLLQATDFSDFGGAIGTMVTAQFDLVGGGAFLDWFVSTGDFNDSTGAFIFTRSSGGGLVPDSFDYRLEVSSRNGSLDVEHGSINLADEILVETPSLLIDAGGKTTLQTTGATGDMLWLFQNNRLGKQSAIVEAE